MRVRKKVIKGSPNHLLHSLRADLLEQYGPLMDGKALQQALGFRSADALRVAINRKRLGFKTFKVYGRPGPFATTSEVAEFLDRQKGTDGDQPPPA